MQMQERRRIRSGNSSPKNAMQITSWLGCSQKARTLAQPARASQPKLPGMKPIGRMVMNIPGSHCGGCVRSRKVRPTMNKPLLSPWLMGFCLFLVGCLFGLTGCAPSVVAEGQLKPTPNATAALPPYPGPISSNQPPLPTQADGTIDDGGHGWWAVTPLPAEQVIGGG